jgi:hypothetical protein
VRLCQRVQAADSNCRPAAQARGRGGVDGKDVAQVVSANDHDWPRQPLPNASKTATSGTSSMYMLDCGMARAG